MIGFPCGVRIHLALEPHDMRKSFNGLATNATRLADRGLESGALFAFTNKRRKQSSFNIPIRHGDHRVSVASIAWAATARGPTKGTERSRVH